MFNLEENKNFKGSLSEFIKIIKEAMYHQYGINDDKITERLVRYYITKSIIPRPFREGKDVFYTYEHILKFLYARKQIIDGWPMGKFREIMKFEENEYFENFLKNYSKSDISFDSMSLIREFKSQTRYSPERKFRNKLNPLKYTKRVDIPNLQDALVAIDADLGNVVKQEFTTFQLASWLVLLIENHKLSGMTYELSRKIGDAISSSLIERKPMTSQELQKEFSQHKENEELKYKMQKLTNENEYLRHKIKEETEDKYKSENLKSDAIEKLKKAIEKYRINSIHRIEKDNITSVKLSADLNSFFSKVEDNIKSENFKKQLPGLLKSFEMNLTDSLEREIQNSFHQNEDELKKLQLELDRITSILLK